MARWYDKKGRLKSGISRMPISNNRFNFNERVGREVAKGHNADYARHLARRAAERSGDMVRIGRVLMKEPVKLTRAQMYRNLRAQGASKEDSGWAARYGASRSRQSQAKIMQGVIKNANTLARTTNVQNTLGEQKQLERLKRIMKSSDDGLKTLRKINQSKVEQTLGDKDALLALKREMEKNGHKFNNSGQNSNFRSSGQTMDAQTRKSMKAHYYRQDRRARGLAAG